MYKKCHPIRDREAYDLYLAQNPSCMICGRSANLSRHHIIGGTGRSDEPCNLIVACLLLCHLLAEGGIVKHNGKRFMPLSLGQMLSIKKARSPLEWNAERLAELRGSALPDLEPIPEWVDAMYFGRMPR